MAGTEIDLASEVTDRQHRNTMKCSALLFAVSLTMLASPALAQPVPESAKANVISCAGPFAPDSNFAKLQQSFGAANVTNEQIDGAEGDKVRVTVLFAKIKARRIEISWNNKARKRINMVTLGHSTQWVASGVQIGSTLAEVEALNGKPFTLAGFDWDYAGTVTDWQDGKLETLPGGCRLGVRFDADRQSPAAARDKVTGDKDFASTDATIRAARPRVYEIFLSYPDEPAKSE
ncbi:MAG TPA: hypothetical protein VGM57_17410 [Pseudolabrys sp.]